MRISKDHSSVKYSIFNGGMSTRLASHLIEYDEAVISVNVEPTSAVLKPKKDKTSQDIEIERYFFYYQDKSEWLSFPTPHDFLEYQGVAYYGDREGQIQRYDGETTSNISIERPENPCTIELLYKADPVDTFDIAQSSMVSTFDEGLPRARFSYMLFNRNDLEDPVYSTPFVFTLDATDFGYINDKVQGSITPYDPDNLFVFDPVNTDQDLENKQYLTFHTFKYSDEDRDDPNIVGLGRLILYRYYNKAWRSVDTIYPENSAPEADREIWEKYYDLNTDTPSHVLDESKLSPFFGTYQYVYTYYNKTLDIESAPSPVSEELEAESGWIVVRFPETPNPSELDPQITHLRLYRIGGQQTVFTLVAETLEFSNQYIDNKKTDQLEGDILSSQNYDNPPDGLKYLIESQGMFFGADKYTLRFTDVGVPHAWSELYFIEYESEITGLAQVAHGVLVFTQYKTHLITGNSPVSLVSQLLTSDHGCLSHDSIAQAEYGRVIWVDQSGLCISNGGRVDNISNQYVESIEFNTTKSDTLKPIRATNANQIYYVQLDSDYTFIWDYRYQKHVPYFADYSIDSIYSANGLVYGRENGLLQELESSEIDLEYQYLTSKYIGESYTLLKTFDMIYIIGSGQFDIKAIITTKSGESSITKSFNSSNVYHTMRIPQTLRQGYAIQFEITGKGYIDEILVLNENSFGSHHEK